MCYFGEATSINFLFSPDRSTHVGWSLQKYQEFSLKNLEKMGISHQKPWENREFCLGKKSKNPE